MTNPATMHLFEQAEALLDANRLLEAKALYAQICERDPSDAEAYFMLGTIHGEMGLLDEAVGMLNEAIARRPDDADARFALASVLKEQGKFNEAAVNAQRAVELDPDYPEAWLLLGAVRGLLGCYQEAEASSRHAIALQPDLASAHANLANALREQGRLEEAVESYQKALQFRSDLADAWLGLGGVYGLMQQSGKAERCYRTVLELDQDNPAAHVGLGNVQQQAGKLEEALSSYQKCVRLKPDFAEALNNMGAVLQAKGDAKAAVEAYRAALQARPDFPEALKNLGDALQSQGRSDAAVAQYQKALQLKPDLAGLHHMLGRAYQELGDPDAAIEMYQTSLAHEDDAALRVRMATVLPVIVESREQIGKVRARLERNLEFLLDQSLFVMDPAAEIDSINFYLVYHGLDDLRLQRLMSTVYEHSAPSLNYIAPHCLEYRQRSHPERIAVGLISRFFNNHTIGSVMKGIIAHLSKEQFEVTVFTFPQEPDANSRFIAEHADHVVELSLADLAAARDIVAERELDVLFYTDIGMDPFTYYMAFSRLAPVQCTSWGHPVTTGIANIDYYISCKDFEPDDAEQHYSEKLVCLNSPPTYYYGPIFPEARSRAHYGVGDIEHLYLCPQTLFKFHPDFDEILAGILKADQAGQLVLFETKYERWAQLLWGRLERNLPDVLTRVRILPYPGPAGYLDLLAQADVILDTLHYGGGSSSLQALGTGTPIVTLPGAFQRGRHTYAYYRKMGLMECVASDREDYVRIAVRLGTDKVYRQQVKAKILAKNSVLYEDLTVVRELEAFFTNAVDEARLESPHRG